MLTLGVAVRIARDPAADELAVGGDAVERVGGDDVGARAAANCVPPAVVLGGDPIRAGTAVEEVGAAGTVEEFVADLDGTSERGAALRREVAERVGLVQSRTSADDLLDALVAAGALRS